VSLRIRSDGRILCAAMHEAEPGDTYLDDGIHHRLCRKAAIITEPMNSGTRGGHAKHGEWWWRDEVPADVTVEDFSHVPLKAWQEKYGEISWLCSCGAHNKHHPVQPGSAPVPFVCIDQE
jgi:hypothetical protein